MSKLLEIQPSRELKFTVELEKQSTCNVQLINKTDRYIAFKVKTTTPKKYCVRPNIGVILPNETCEFVVIMQAQRSAPPDMICKDKFLVQSTIVSAGTIEDDVTSDTFSKEDGKYIEERKLKVTLVSPPHSPELSPMNGKLKQVPPVESSVVADELLNRIGRHSLHHVDVEHFKEVANKEVQKPMVDAETETVKNVKSELPKVAEPGIVRDVDFKPIKVVESNSVDKVEARPMKGMEPIKFMKSNSVDKLEARPMKGMEPIKVMESNSVDKLEARPIKGMEPIKVMESNSVDKLEARPMKGMEPIKVVESNSVDKLAGPMKGLEQRMMKDAVDPRLVKDVKEMKSKLLELESKVCQAEKTISKLTEERRLTIQEREILQQELALLRTRIVQKTIQEGYPLLFVCMVAVISIVIGYLLHR